MKLYEVIIYSRSEHHCEVEAEDELEALASALEVVTEDPPTICEVDDTYVKEIC